MLPVVDLHSTDSHKAVADSLSNSGFAVVTNHGIAATQLHEFYQVWDQFFLTGNKFDFPADPNTQAGYFSTTDAETAKDAKAQDLKEYFQYWPGGELPDSLSELTLQLYNQMFELAENILNALQEHTHEVIWQRLSKPLTECLSRQDTMIRILRYPPLTGNEPDNAMRAAAHEDINFITLLPAASQSGLEIRPKGKNWQPVLAPDGAIIINLGDMLQELTDKALPSTTHRVVNPTGEGRNVARITAPLFCHPEPALRLSEAYTAGDYLQERLAEINPEQMRPS